jgi:uncharacterized protein YjbI with pentapeptide repeats
MGSRTLKRLFAGLLFAGLTLGAAHAFNADDLARLKASGSCERCDLRGADLKGMDLAGANLTRASLRNSDLKDPNLSGADLANAIFSDAVFRPTNLSGTDLRTARGLQDEQLEMACGDGTKVPDGMTNSPCD